MHICEDVDKYFPNLFITVAPFHDVKRNESNHNRKQNASPH